MKSIPLGALAALGLSVQLAGQQPVAVNANTDDRVTLVGCVIKGDGGSVLSSVAGTWGPTSAGSAATTVTSASKVAGRIFYWLDGKDLDDHAGRKVEVVGKLDNEIDKAKISVEREDRMVEIEFKADGERKVTVKVPEMPASVGTSGGVSDRDSTHQIFIRKIDVKSIKVLASTCQ